MAVMHGWSGIYLAYYESTVKHIEPFPIKSGILQGKLCRQKSGR
jgi:hypothetical protein